VLIYSVVIGKHHIYMEVIGTGIIAQILRAIFKGMNTTHEIDNYTSTGGNSAYRLCNIFYMDLRIHCVLKKTSHFVVCCHFNKY